MQFSNPAFLFALSAVLIPVIIHLFNFRKYKKVHFSNVQLLQDIVQKTKRESQLLHFIVLCLRMLAIAALVFAFAQPFVPNARHSQKGGATALIFVDNSFSMTANTQSSNLLQDAVETARNIVNAYPYTYDFILVTQDFSPKESRLLNKDEILSLLDEVEVSACSRSWDEITDYSRHIAQQSKKGEIYYYYISDFQKDEYNFDDFKSDAAHPSFLVAMESSRAGNISIDSCRFVAPVFKLGQQVTLYVAVHNYSEQDVEKLPLRLYINKEQKAIVAMDLKAGSAAEYQLNYTITEGGIQTGRLQLDDAQITFDNELFFVYEVSPSTKIIAINDGAPNKYLTSLYGKDSLFTYMEMNVSGVNYSQFDGCQLVVLNEVKSISSGMAGELKKYVEGGGSLMIFPSEQQDTAGWQSLLTSLGVPCYGKMAVAEVKVGSINTESIYFKRALEKQSERLDMPKALQYFELKGIANGEVLMRLENQAPLLSVYSAGKGKLFLSAVALNDKFGDVHKHALFIIPMHNIGIMSQIDRRLYNVMGRNEMQSLNGMVQDGDAPVVLKLQDNGDEIIPEQRNNGNSILLFFHNQIKEPGFYDLLHRGARVGVTAFNYNRGESNLDYYSDSELLAFSKRDNAPFTLMDGAAKDLTQSIADHINGTPLWYYFVLLALLCLLAEVLILRFWSIGRR
ncbi:MAG: BatA domain-containing protein [Bacteroidales bacterium]|jgi:hypothetical protein|nr:BatA domain-containing protein [Bacteroidales bacterium]